MPRRCSLNRATQQQNTEHRIPVLLAVHAFENIINFQVFNSSKSKRTLQPAAKQQRRLPVYKRVCRFSGHASIYHKIQQIMRLKQVFSAFTVASNTVARIYRIYRSKEQNLKKIECFQKICRLRSARW